VGGSKKKEGRGRKGLFPSLFLYSEQKAEGGEGGLKGKGRFFNLLTPHKAKREREKKEKGQKRGGEGKEGALLLLSREGEEAERKKGGEFQKRRNASLIFEGGGETLEREGGGEKTLHFYFNTARKQGEGGEQKITEGRVYTFTGEGKRS